MPGASHPGAGTDKTKNWIATPGPIIILVEPPARREHRRGRQRGGLGATACGGLVF
jgi:hypothetical protein